MTSKRKALLIRMGEYNVTQAVPRAAATLQEMGYDVTILSLDQTGERPENENANGWRIIWHYHKYKPGNKLSFLWAWVCWWVWVIRQIYREKYDLIQASNLESIVPCLLVKKFRKFALVLDIRDLWGMMHQETSNLIIRTLKAMEKWGSARVDGMVLCPATLDILAKYFGDKVCKRVPSVQVLNVPGKDHAGTYCPADTKKIRINFSGHISYVRNAQAIIDLAACKPEVDVDIVGEIGDKSLQEALESYDNIKLYGRLPLDQAMELLQKANLISIMYDTSTEIAVISTPNKMFEAMMMSRPYIASKGGFPGITAERYGIGWAVPYGDSEALIELVSELLIDPRKIEIAAQKGRQTYVDNFTWDKQKANLKLLYEYVIDPDDSQFFSYAGWDKMLGSVFCEDM
ncbi:MAG: glycosyltransferase [Planctomycetes bacterium]|nr:glycosyltransferase [Planctomycetota bacterium]